MNAVVEVAVQGSVATPAETPKEVISLDIDGEYGADDCRALSLRAIDRIAFAAAASGRFGDRKKSEAIVKILRGLELGLKPMQSMQSLYVIEGKLGIEAATMASMIQRSGHYAYKLVEITDQRCEIEFFGPDPEINPDSKNPKPRVSLGKADFTVDEAKQARLWDKKGPGGGPSPWQTYTKDMLFARTMARGARRFCPAVFGGPVYSVDDLMEFTARTAGTAAAEQVAS